MWLCLMLFIPFSMTGQEQPVVAPQPQAVDKPVRVATAGGGVQALDSVATSTKVNRRRMPVLDAMGDTVKFTKADSLRLAGQLADTVATTLGVAKFNPDPKRALWLSALCPGLGQIYNHRYWKLPIVVGAFVGLGYGTAWNNRMLSDYTKAYRDLKDSDPNTRSYMNFFPPNAKESDIDKAWLERLLKSKKKYYRRNKEMCIFSMIGVYLLNVVDAYVDASLSHFDISSDLSLDMQPAVMLDGRQGCGGYPSLGLQCAFRF